MRHRRSRAIPPVGIWALRPSPCPEGMDWIHYIIQHLGSPGRARRPGPPSFPLPTRLLCASLDRPVPPFPALGRYSSRCVDHPSPKCAPGPMNRHAPWTCCLKTSARSPSRSQLDLDASLGIRTTYLPGSTAVAESVVVGPWTGPGPSRRPCLDPANCQATVNAMIAAGSQARSNASSRKSVQE
jgi:hypothetical protein